MRVVIDTNVWISYLFGKRLASLSNYIFSDRITILYSQELLQELITVLNRPKFSKHISTNQVERIARMIVNRGEEVTVDRIEPICRDPKDDFLIAIAINGRADYLISGDQDLLVLESYRQTEIMSPGVFHQRLQPRSYVDIKRVSSLINAMYDARRWSIIASISELELPTLDNISKSTGLSHSQLYQHLGLLDRFGLIYRDRPDNEILYMLNVDVIAYVYDRIQKFNKL